MSLQLGAIVDALGGELHGDRAVSIERLAPLQNAQPDALSFLSHPKYQQELAASKAACVIVSPAMREAAEARGAFILTPDPYFYFARLTQLWKAHHARPEVDLVHPSAVIHPEAHVDPTARIGALCVVERGARIGAGEPVCTLIVTQASARAVMAELDRREVLLLQRIETCHEDADAVIPSSA